MTTMPVFLKTSSLRPGVQRSRLYGLGWVLATGVLAACGQPTDGAAKPAEKSQALAPEQAYAQIAAQGKGFAVGVLMAANPVYVLFDPQCPHCGQLWKASQPLHSKQKFVWIPVAFLNGKSAAQGAAILSASQPAELMAAHEASLLAGTGGVPLPAEVEPAVQASIKANTVLFNQLAAESVPYVVAKNLQNDQFVSHAGAMDTAALTSFLGLAP